MSEFDFEELDKAVKGALGTSPSATAAPSTAMASDTTDNLNVSQPVDSSAPAPAQPTPTPAPRPTTGRFMDIVSSSRPMPSRPELSRPVAPEETPVLAAASFEEEVTAAPTPTPLESPFLPDAKVEKRPLGMPETDGRTPDFAPSPKLSIHEELEAALQEEVPEHETVALPDPLAFAEAQQAASVEPPVVSQTPPEVIEVAPEVPSQELPVEPTPVAEASVSEPVPAPAVQASIPQQYTEHPAVQSETATAIYNPETLHQPLLTAGKKHSGVWTVLWIFLLVLLGAAAGGAFYWFVLPLI